ncbi:hypothetical protein AXF42_Ash013078 [Apostasia shenzhenica]|uniref:Integrase catalytic domain-containing protein n=1 Tax=Apostasia shenzhenica TaxID=1088818 RepID=A0A2I0BCZ1_9ASPA|nr:hypothetical protein AXF42_Ash013078 [Apostasia shenzhenica]
MRSYKWILVAVNYFTKWIETKPLTHPTAQNVENFLWANIVCRYDIPIVIITDNGTLFANQRVHDFCGKHQINLKYASVWHPHTNGQTETANKNILNILKKRRDGAKIRWPDELLGALWVYNTAPSKVKNLIFPSPLGWTLLPVELEHFSPKVEVAASFDPDSLETYMKKNGDSRHLDQDFLKQRRQLAALKRMEHKRQIEQHFSRKVKLRDFSRGDLAFK